MDINLAISTDTKTDPFPRVVNNELNPIRIQDCMLITA